MKTRTRWIAAVATAGAALAIAWTMRHPIAMMPGRIRIDIPAGQAAPPAPPIPPTSTATNPRPPERAAKAPPAHALPNSLTPLSEAVPLLREYAGEGDLDAAIELSWRLGACTERALRRSEEHEQSLLRMKDDDKDNDTLSEELRVSRAANVQRQIDEQIQQRKDCRALPADLRADWLAWIDRAAQAGSTAAMRGYARAAIRDYTSTRDVLEEPDTAIERRDKARAYLAEALARGDAEALPDLASAYSPSAHPTIYPVDPTKAYAYAYAGTLAGVAHGRELDDIIEREARSLDGRQLAEAEAEGRRIFEKCCGAH
jgi:hypothetical protein